jgi:hypothetical protein
VTLLVLQVLGQAAALDHEAGDDAMENRAVEKAFVGVAIEVFHRDRRLLVEQLDGESAFGRLELEHVQISSNVAEPRGSMPQATGLR